MGAKFESLSVENQVFNAEDTYPIDLRHVKINGDFDMSHSIVWHPINATGLCVKGRVNFESAQFRLPVYFDRADMWYVNFSNATFDAEVSVRDSELHRINASRSTFCGELQIKHTKFGTSIHPQKKALEFSKKAHDSTSIKFNKSKFEERVQLVNNLFKSIVSIRKSSFGDKLLMKETVFCCSVAFDDPDLNKGMNINGCDFCDEVILDGGRSNGTVKITDCRFEGRTMFDETRFRDDFYIDKTEMVEGLSISYSIFEKMSVFRDVALPAANFIATEFRKEIMMDLRYFLNRSGIRRVAALIGIKVDNSVIPEDTSLYVSLERASIDSGRITINSVNNYYNMEMASIGSVQLEDETGDDRSRGSIFEQIKIVETSFDGFRFADHREHLSRAGWAIHTFSDKNSISSRKAEKTYIKAKEGASLAGEDFPAPRFFRKERKFRRKAVFDTFTGRDTDQWVSDRPARIDALWRWIGSWILTITTGYGELPYRVMISSIGVILGFTAAYSCFGKSLSGGAIGEEYLLFSIQSFTAFIIGAPISGQASFFLRFLSAVEAFLGAFFIALFVFTLTRGVNR